LLHQLLHPRPLQAGGGCGERQAGVAVGL
jgi:hypothetical protein